MDGLRNFLRERRGLVAPWALSFAFATYFCMYAFRKPFTAATYDHIVGWPFAFDFKASLILSQVLGYTLSKALGIRIVAEADDRGRGWLILALIGLSELSLVLFAVLPTALKPFAMFLNGLPLGMIWSLVLRYLEGRRTSEILGAGLCTSFILSSGVVKSVGLWLLVERDVADTWMPALAGAIFLPIIACSIFLLAQTPAPDSQDKEERTARVPMRKADRQAFFQQHRLELFLLGGAFALLATVRDFRDNFAVEIWRAVGYAKAPQVLALSEAPAALLVLVTVALLARVKDNRQAVRRVHLAMLGGVALALTSTILFQLKMIGPIGWMISLGAGIYLGYVPCTSVLADRLIAALRSGGNTGYLVNLFDTWAYLGSVLILLMKAFALPDVNWLPFFLALSYVCLSLSAFGILASYGRFLGQRETTP
jgi:hypothetical protein